MPPTGREWDCQAECKEAPQEWFFPERSNSPFIPLARKVCNDCPVREPCLNEALEDKTLTGIWGGTTEEERVFLRIIVGSGTLREAVGD